MTNKLKAVPGERPTGYISGFHDATDDFTEADRVQLQWEERQRIAAIHHDTRPTWRRIVSHIYWRSELPKIVEWCLGLWRILLGTRNNRLKKVNVIKF